MFTMQKWLHGFDEAGFLFIGGFESFIQRLTRYS